MKQYPNIELRSEVIQDILTSPPNRLIRWGNTLVLLILILILFFSWFIKYPDMVTAEVKIMSNVPPEKLRANASGRFEQILVKNNQKVKAGTILAVIENPAIFDEVKQLKTIIEDFEKNNHFNFPIETCSQLKLGNIGQAYTQFERDYVAFINYSTLKPHQATLTSYQLEKSEWQQRYGQLKAQQDLASSELILKKREFERFKTLYDKGVISAQEFENKQVDYLQFEKNVKQLQTQVSQMQSTYNNLTADNQNKRNTQAQDNVNMKRNMLLSLYQLQRSIKDWEYQFVLKSSIAGQVTFLSHWAKHQNVSAGDEIFGVVNETESGFIGKAKVKSQNLGKVKKGQKVWIGLDYFPEREFGKLEGKVSQLSAIPDKEGYVYLDISLSKGLLTNYKKDLLFQQEMSGRADIVTQDLRLIERFFYQFRDVYARN